MISQFRNKLRSLPSSNKSMIYLLWIYQIGQAINTIFISIYIFQIQHNILHTLIYALIFYFGTFIGFGIFGSIAAFFRKNIKNFYYFSYGLFIISMLILLFGNESILNIYLFASCYGIGNGLFWCALHCQELYNIKDHNRDFYSSSISVGANSIKIIIPFLVSLLFFIFPKSEFNTYIFLFLFLPVLYFLSFIFIHNIGNYSPTPISSQDTSHFFSRRQIFGVLYFFSTGISNGLSHLLPIIAFFFLKNEVNIGFFEGVIGIISILSLIILSHFRNRENRMKIMGISCILLALNYFVFIFHFSLLGYIVFSLLFIFLQPIYRVSGHIYDLRLMDTIRAKGSDFFPSMILREYMLILGRSFILIAFICIYSYFDISLSSLLQIGLYISPFIYILHWIFVFFHIQYETNNS